MTEFHSPHGPLTDHLPDDLTVVQFMLDYHHPMRQVRPASSPWFIDDTTGRQVFYEEVRTRTFGLANAFHHKFGFGTNDVACIFSPNDVDYPIAIWATHRLGGAVSTANPTYTADELAYQLTAIKTNILLVHPAVLDTALAAAKKAGLPEDRVVLFKRLPNSVPTAHPTFQELITKGLRNKNPAFVERKLAPGETKKKIGFYCFSSGTTGRPKAVAISHFAVIANTIQGGAWCQLGDPSIPLDKHRYRAGDITSGILPLFHIYGLIINLHFMLFAGMTVDLMPKFNFEEFLKSIVRYKITHLMLVPPMIVLLCKHPAVHKYDLSSVRGVWSGAAPLSSEIVQMLSKIIPGATIGQGYGMTETATTVSSMRLPDTLTDGSVGALLPGVVARVVKQDGTLARVGETGELQVTGPSMALGYANNAEATAETFIDGWVRTGDEVKFDERGDLHIVDRLKELIKVRGFQVAPAELEGHLLDHKYVIDACVVPVPDEYSGEVPLAFIVPHASIAGKIKANPAEAKKIKAELAKHVSDHKTKYKWLVGGVEFIDEIPKTTSGKLLRRVLREQARELKKVSAKL